MARLASQAKMGYYPTPVRSLDLIARWLDAAETHSPAGSGPDARSLLRDRIRCDTKLTCRSSVETAHPSPLGCSHP